MSNEPSKPIQRLVLDLQRVVQEQDAHAGARRRRRLSTPLLATIASVVAAGGAIAAVATGVLDTGAPIPSNPQHGFAQRGHVRPGSAVVLPLRVPDPDGGPPWGLALYDVEDPLGGRATTTAATFRCLRTGRVQDGQLGIVGRDGAFEDDGRFHPVAEESALTGTCSRLVDDQTVQSGGTARIPASGYTGSPGTPIGGCLKHPILSTASAETRRRLGDRPLCDPAGARLVRAGFAGKLAARVTLANDRVHLTQKPGPSGAYLFVVTPTAAGPRPLRLTATYRDGTVCAEPLHMARRGHRSTSDPDCLPVPGF